tara:strand:- start:19712 stop:19942 length:231 start_codon:yes stop_codon:yes gene_type:complete
MNSRKKLNELNQVEHRLNARIEALEQVVSRSAKPTQRNSPLRRKPVNPSEREHFRQFLMLLGILIGVALWMLYLAT